MRRRWSVLDVVAVMLLGALLGAALAPPPAHAVLGTPVGGRDWPTYGHDLHRTFNGRTTLDSSSVLTLAPAWFFMTGLAVTANPVVVNGTVYVGSWDGNF